MLQPVIPYTISGLALGSLLKQPGAGALVGSVVGVALASSKSKGVGLDGYGLQEREFYAPPPVAQSSGPSTVTDMASAKRAAKFAVQQSGKSGEPWRGAATPEDVLRKTLGTKLSVRQRGYLIGLLGSYRKRMKTTRKQTRARKPSGSAQRTSVSVQGLREDTSRYISQAMNGDGGTNVEAGSPWFSTPKGKIGLAALAGTGALILILMLTSK
jgi:hypothetical protein